MSAADIRSALFSALKAFPHASESFEFRKGYTGEISPDGKKVEISYRSTHIPTDICRAYRSMAQRELLHVRRIVETTLWPMATEIGGVEYDDGCVNCKGWIKVTVHMR